MLSTCPGDQTIATILDLVDTPMSDSQLYSYDALEELFLDESQSIAKILNHDHNYN